MKYRCFCHKSYKEITKIEARSMLRSARRWTIGEFMDYYDIPRSEIWAFITARGMNMTNQERVELREWESRNAKKQVGLDLHNVSKWPKSIVAALGNVPYEIVKGKRFYDAEAIARTIELLQNQIDLYQTDDIEKKSSKLRKNDLVAMRYYRGFSRRRMAKELLKTPPQIEQLENEFPVSIETERLYKDVLNITNAHVKQLRKVMKGKLDRVEEDRKIPKSVKLKVYGRDQGVCSNCGSDKKLHFHHIEKFSEGGQNTEDNLKLLCAACHAEEHRDDKSYYLLKRMAEED